MQLVRFERFIPRNLPFLPLINVIEMAGIQGEAGLT
jgi:hypothetical protein